MCDVDQAAEKAASLPSRGAWIEIVPTRWRPWPRSSLPSRGAWIEIYFFCFYIDFTQTVAPLAGSVDRNVYLFSCGYQLVMSLPSRGAWIEIFLRPG